MGYFAYQEKNVQNLDLFVCGTFFNALLSKRRMKASKGAPWFKTLFPVPAVSVCLPGEGRLSRL
jgi:hypothetical protein